MNNLKRVLSLALASVMLIGMMAVGASAKTFTDADSIENKDAVNAMVALNIISGYPDGSYKPDDLVTRAEAAKMIYVAIMGGKDNPNLTTKTNPTFSDVTNWAQGYVEYCASPKVGIIAGHGDGTFRPNDKLTGSQLAKMMLVAIGYDAEVEGLQGTSDWEINTNALALQRGFFDGLTDLNPSEYISRDDAAQLILNAATVEMVTYDFSIKTDANGNLTSKGQVTKTGETLLKDRYDIKTGEGYLTAVEYDKDTKKFTYTFNAGTDLGMEAVDALDGTPDVTTTDDYTDLFGERVKVMYKDNTITNSVDLYGFYSVSGKVYNTVKSDYNGTNGSVSATAGDDTVALAANQENIPVYRFTNGTLDTAVTLSDLDADTTGATYAQPSTLKLISGNTNAKVDYAIYIPATVEKVTYKGTATVNLSTSGSVVLADADVYEGIAKDDFVIYKDPTHSFTGKATLIKADTVEGTVDAKIDTDAQVNGEWYSMAAGSNEAAINKNVKLVVVGSYYYNVTEINEKTLDDVLFVAAAGEVKQSGLSTGSVEAKVYFADGTSSDVMVSTVNSKTAVDVTVNAAEYVNTAGKVLLGGLYTYSVKDGKYALTLLSATNKAGYSAFLNKAGDENVADADYAYSHDANTLKTPGISGEGEYYAIADDAVVFVAYKTKLTGSDPDTTVDGAKAAVITGKELKVWEKDWGKNVQVLYNTVTGVKTAQVVALISEYALPTATKAGGYGFVLAQSSYKKVSGVDLAAMSIWNGTETVTANATDYYSVDNDVTTVTSELVGAAPFTKGSYVSYNTDSKGQLTRVTSLESLGGFKAAITGIKENKNGQTVLTLAKDGNTTITADYLVSKDTEVIYLNGAKGAEGGTFSLATPTKAKNETYSVKNVFVKLAEDGDGNVTDEIEVIFVDTANNLYGNAAPKVVAVDTVNYTVTADTIIVKGDGLNINTTNDLTFTKEDWDLTHISDPTDVQDGEYVILFGTNGATKTYKFKFE